MIVGYQRCVCLVFMLNFQTVGVQGNHQILIGVQQDERLSTC